MTDNPKIIYEGACHCGNVRFELAMAAPIREVTRCNCSICQKKGAIHLRVTQDAFKLTEGEDHLSLYQFNTKTAKHYFCKTCGIHPFSRPRIAPDMISVNINCLEGANKFRLKIKDFDGENWELACQKQKEGIPDVPFSRGSSPATVKVKGGRRYSWCACGLSKTQPFCDNTHRGSTTMRSLKFTPLKDGEVHLCMCKRTKNPPFCDGSHAKGDS